MARLSSLANFLRHNFLIVFLVLSCGAGVAQLFGNILISGNTISSTDPNGNINIDPGGTGQIVLEGPLSGAGILDEDDMSSDSATAVPTQQSTKAYVDSVDSDLNAHINDAIGAHDASAITFDPSANDLISTSAQAAIVENRVFANAVDSDLNSHVNDTTSVHGIADTSVILTEAGTADLSNKTFIDSLRLTEIAEPSSPASGIQSLFIDSSDQKLKLKNSSGTVSEVGSGAGSSSGVGINLLSSFNPGFEDGDPPDNWTSSGGSFSAENTNPLTGSQSGLWDASADAQTLSSQAVTIEEGFIGRTCSAEILYKWNGTATELVFEALDTGSVVASKDLAVSTTARKAQLIFDCPGTITDTLQMRVRATADADAITIDDSFLGRDRNTFQLSQAEFIAEAFYPTTASCLWSSGGGLSLPSATSACPAITVNQSNYAVNTTDDNLPNIVFDDLPPGIYSVEANFPGNSTASGANIIAAISDGTDTGPGCAQARLANTEQSQHSCSAVFRYESSGARTFSIHLGSSSGDLRLENRTSNDSLSFKVVRYPLNSAEAITLETVGWYVDANIGGANPNLGTSDVSSYTEITDGGLDLVLNNGSADAQIPCASGNASSGLTCSAGAESVGIVFDAPAAGRYKVCMEFGDNINLPTGGSNTDVSVVFQLAETSNTSSTITTEGNSRIRSGILTGGSNSDIDQTAYAHNTCGWFNFSTAGQKTIRLLYEMDVVNTPDNVQIIADRSASQGQRDIHVTVEQLNQQFPTPVFTDLTDSLNSKMVNDISSPSGDLTAIGFFVNESGGSLSVVKDLTGAVDSITDSGAGDYTVNWTSGYWASDPICTGSPTGTNRTVRVTIPSTSNMSVDILTTNSGVAADVDVQFVCVGEIN